MISRNQNVERDVHALDTPATQKRARIQLSCTSCRHAKLRCDRGHPCSQCLKRDQPSLCIYATVPVRQRPTKSMQSRLQNLEKFVIDMLKDQRSRNGSSGSDSLQLSSLETPATRNVQPNNTQDLFNLSTAINPGLEESQTASAKETLSGKVVLGMKETAYVGATHWAAILDDIEEVKGYFNEAPDEHFSSGNEEQTAAMALGNTTPTSRAELLAALPERAVVDRLVSRYFNSNDPAMIIIHKPSFQKEYQEFWADPSSKPIMWLGLLFSLLSLAVFYSIRAGDEPLESLEYAVQSATKYRTLCSQSLVLANYFKPGPYTIEALLLYFEGEFALPGDSAAKCWVLHAMAVRLALRMGYHRDAKYHSNISAFHGEMRRRVWHLLVQVDLILSFQVGLPSMIRAVQSDTAPPHNLLDGDFSQTSPELPQSRPESERTPMSYMICKARLCHVFGLIVDQENSISQPSYSEVLDLDSQLREVYGRIPSFLLIRPLDQSVTDSPNLIMQRFNIILLYHKSRCVLHRKCLTKEDPGSQYSQHSCVDSASELLRYQGVINDAVQIGGPLSRDRWFLTTIAAHDFLLGAMIIYLSLTHTHKGKSADQAGDEFDFDSTKRLDMLRKLEISYETWKKSPKEARDAKKASGVLEIILRNARRGLFSEGQRTLAPSNESGPTSSYAQSSFPHGDILAFDKNYRIFPGSPRRMEGLGAMIDMPDTLDWETWDNHINAPMEKSPEDFWTSDMNFDDVDITDNMIAAEDFHN